MINRMKLSAKCLFTSVLLMIFVCFIFVSNYPQFHRSGRAFDEGRYIEQALQHIPTCSINDRARQRALLYTLHEWNQFAQRHHIPYWIGHTTLLGYVHQQGLLPHQREIDLFIRAHQTSHLLHLSRSQIPLTTYKLKVHPQWYLVKYTERSYFHSQGIDFIAPNARFINTDEQVHINIWPVYDYNLNKTRMDNNPETMLTVYDRTYQWKSSPREWTYPLQECEYSGVNVWCPAKAQELARDFYGETVDQLVKKECVNGTWINDKEFGFSTGKMKTTNTQLSVSTVTSKDLSDDDLIKRALDELPTCTSSDRHHQTILLTNLLKWSQLAQKHHLQYWISAGSLVGYVQRGGLIPHDSDIDITMLTDDVPQLINIGQSNIPSDYQLIIHPQWNIVAYQNRSYYYDDGIPFVTPNARFIHRKSRRHVDIFPAYHFNPNFSESKPENQSVANLTEYNTAYEWFSYPREWTYPLQTCYFSGIKVLCPAQPKKLVEAVYGVEALTVSDTVCINGKWKQLPAKTNAA